MSLDCHSQTCQFSTISDQTVDVNYSIWVFPGMEGAFQTVLSQPLKGSDIDHTFNHILNFGILGNFNFSVKQFSAFCLSDLENQHSTISTAYDSSLKSTVLLAALGCASAMIVSIVFVCRGSGCSRACLSSSSRQARKHIANSQFQDNICFDNFSLKDQLKLEEGLCIAKSFNSDTTLCEQRRASLGDLLTLDGETELVDFLARNVELSSGIPANLLTANNAKADCKTGMYLIASSQKVLANLEKRLPEGPIDISEFEAELDRNKFFEDAGECQSELSLHSLEM